jgi:hypothetical protein
MHSLNSRRESYECIDSCDTSKIIGSHGNYGVYCKCMSFELAMDQSFEVIPGVQMHVTADPKPKKLKLRRCKCGHGWNKHTGDNLECAQRKSTPGNERISVELCDCKKFVSEVLTGAGL